MQTASASGLAAHATEIQSGKTAARLISSTIAFAMGLAIVLFSGFSHVEAVHNAAHDTRHTLAFPCH